MNSPTTMPQKAKMSEGLRVFDLAAGQSHSVFLADGDCCQPILFYSGQQMMETIPEKHIPGTGSTESSPSMTDTYTLRPVLLPFCMNMGYISSVYGGGQSCLAQADLNVMGFISALHELAAADRKFYCRLRDVKKRVVRPLLKKESVCTVLGPTSTLLFQSLASCYSRLCHLTGQHSVSLTAFLRTDRDVKGLVILKHANTFLDMYQEYCGSVGNFLVMGGFQALMKPSVECFGKKLEVLRQLSESSEDKVPLFDLLVTLFYSPIQHVREYGRLLLKLATCFDVSTVEYQRLQEGCSRYEALSRSLRRKRKEAETTNQFWRTYSGKTTDALRQPLRRLVEESSNKSLTLQNAGRFSVNWFILFNDALIHAQVRVHGNQNL
eukprot:XP_014021205.1 PREDICTED: alsin-like [Salmo salar]